MKRTIKVRVEIADANEYASVLNEIVNHPSVIESAWTSHQDVKAILETKYGMTRKFGHGKIDDTIPD